MYDCRAANVYDYHPSNDESNVFQMYIIQRVLITKLGELLCSTQISL